MNAADIDPESPLAIGVGRWRVVTLSGSVYVLDLDAGTAARIAGDGAGQLRQDGEPTPLLRVLVCTVGAPMYLVVSGLHEDGPTLRGTTVVVSVGPEPDAPEPYTRPTHDV